MRFEITYKEVGRNHEGHCSMDGNKTRQEVIDFFGLDGDDVEWYKIEEVKQWSK